jgi:hypothetical protein
MLLLEAAITIIPEEREYEAESAGRSGTREVSKQSEI